MSHFGRPKGKVNPDYSLEVTLPAIAEAFGHESHFRRDGLGRRLPPQSKPLTPRPRVRCWCLKTPASIPARKRTIPNWSKRMASLGDILHQRCLFLGPPRPCLDRGRRPPAARGCRHRHGRRADRARKGPRQSAPPGRRHCRRRQGVDQDRPFGKSHRQGRGPGPLAAAWPTPSCSPKASASAIRWPRRTWPKRPGAFSTRRKRSAVTSSCRSTPRLPGISRPMRPTGFMASTPSTPTA